MLLNSKQFILTSASRQSIWSMTTSTKVNSFTILKTQKSIHSLMLKKKIMAYVHQLLDHPSQWQTSQQAGPGSVPKFTSTSITVKQLLIENKNINQSKSSLLIWHYVSYLFLYKVGWSTVTSIRARPYAWTSLLLMMTNHRYLALFKDMFSFIPTKVFFKKNNY